MKDRYLGFWYVWIILFSPAFAFLILDYLGGPYITFINNPDMPYFIHYLISTIFLLFLLPFFKRTRPNRTEIKTLVIFEFVIMGIIIMFFIFMAGLASMYPG